MNRREFITLLGGAAAAWPRAVRAQQPALPVIGFLSSTSRQVFASRLGVFAQGLKAEGYVDGQNVAIEYRFAEDEENRLPALAVELAQQRLTVFVAGGSPSTVAAQAAAGTVPIVFETAGDPVSLGFVTSLIKPGGNLTGVSNLNSEVGPKRLELVRELLPAATIVAVLVNPSAPTITNEYMRRLEAAAAEIGRAHV